MFWTEFDSLKKKKKKIFFFIFLFFLVYRCIRFRTSRFIEYG